MEGIGYCDLWKGPVEKSSPLGDSFLEWHQTFVVNQLPQVTCNKDLRQGPFGAPSRTSRRNCFWGWVPLVFGMQFLRIAGVPGVSEYHIRFADAYPSLFVVQYIHDCHSGRVPKNESWFLFIVHFMFLSDRMRVWPTSHLNLSVQ